MRIITSKEHRWGSSVQTKVGIIKFDNDGIAEISEEKFSELVKVDDSISEFTGKSVKKDSLDKANAAIITAGVNKDKLIEELDKKNSVCESRIVLLESFIKDNGLEVPEKSNEDNKLPKMTSEKLNQLDIADLKDLAKLSGGKVKEYDKLDKSKLIKYILNINNA